MEKKRDTNNKDIRALKRWREATEKSKSTNLKGLYSKGDTQHPPLNTREDPRKYTLDHKGVLST